MSMIASSFMNLYNLSAMNQNYEISTDKIHKYLNDQLKETDWYNVLRSFVRYLEFEEIIEKLRHEVGLGYRFTPAIHQIFRPFELCALKDVKMVLCRRGPYIHPSYNDGLAFSSTGYPKNWEFRLFSEATGITSPDGDLQNFAKSGVLMLNTSLTTEIGLPHSHEALWTPFVRLLISVMPPVPWVFVGDNPHAQDVDNALLFPEFQQRDNYQKEFKKIFADLQ